TKARIHSISTDRMRRALDDGKIVIAAGFQGVDEESNITTLGRGGSDTTAVALAAVLGADACEIYTDVDGVYTTDPRVLPEARRVKQVSYDEMLELASLGAGVMHSRSIEFAKKFSVPIHVRSSFSDIPGTMIVADPEAPGQAVGGATLVKNEARVTILGVPDKPGTSHGIFSNIAAKNISVDMIVQNVGSDARADISFTVIRDDLPTTLQAVAAACQELGAEGYTHDENVSKVSVVGLGMATQTGVAQKMFRALAGSHVNIEMISTSEIKISVLVSRDDGLPALRTVHGAFQLDQTPPGAAQSPHEAHRHRNGDATAIVARLQGMEDLTITDIRLD
ncbi:MAG: aspartate kinase, partial [Pirellulales bacterium]